MRVEWEGHPVEVRELGAGPTVFLIHGFPLDGAMWSGAARTLAERFRVLKPDLPGRPDNPSLTSPSLEAYADYVAALLEALPAPVGLAGFSMGGYVAFALMKRRPEQVRALALVDTRAAADDAAGRVKREEMLATLREKGVGAVAEAMLGRLLAADSLRRPDLVDRVRRIMLRQKRETLERDILAMRDRPDSTVFLREITVPTLVLVGEHDVISTPAECQAMVTAIPGARLVTVPNAGHLTPMERPGAVARALGDFFSEAFEAK